MQPLITIVIVNYETSAFVRRCVQSLQFQSHPHEIVIVDNPSPAGDCVNLPTGDNVRVVRADTNLGYGLGCNLAAEHASPDSAYICILNPDTAVPDGELTRWIESYLVTCPTGGISGPALHNDNGSVQRSKYMFMTGLSYWFTHSLLAGFWVNLQKGSWTGGKGRGFEEASDLPEREFQRPDNPGQLATQVDWLMGAALLANTHTWKSLDGFSDKFFMYSEDTEICWRCHKLGLPVVYDPGVHLWHSQGDPSSAARERAIIMLFDGIKRFVDQYYTGARRAFMYAAVVADMSLRITILNIVRIFIRNNILLESRLRGYRTVLRQWAGAA